MPDFSLTDLWNLAESAAKNVRDDYQLYDLAIVVDPPRITAGIVSAVVRALEADHVIYRKPTQKPAPENPASPPPVIETSRLTVQANGGVALTPAPELTAHEIAVSSHQNALEAEDPSREEPAPEVAAKPAPPQASVAQNDSADPDGWTEAQHKVYHRTAILLKRMARQGFMPTMAEFDAAERGELATAQAICTRLGLKWSEIAARLGLTVQTNRSGPDKGNAGNPLGEDATEPTKAASKSRGTLTVGDSGLVEAAQPAPVPASASKRPAVLPPEPTVEPKPILHRAPDGGITTILRSADGRHVRMLRTFEGK